MLAGAVLLAGVWVWAGVSGPMAAQEPAGIPASHRPLAWWRANHMTYTGAGGPEESLDGACFGLDQCASCHEFRASCLPCHEYVGAPAPREPE